MKQQRTVLLTGGTGFIGSHMLEGLLKAGYDVVVLKRSFSDTRRIERLLPGLKVYDVDLVSLETPFKEKSIDVIVHMAASYGRGGESNAEILDSNLVFPLTLLELATEYKVDTFINTDTFFNIGYRHMSAYTLSKKQFVDWMRIYSDRLEALNLRLEHVYGPGDAPHKFVPWLISQLLDDKKEILLTEGRQERDFIYVSDVVEACLFLLDKVSGPEGFREFNVGTGRPTALKDFVIKTKDAVSKITGAASASALVFGAMPYAEGELMKTTHDIDEVSGLGFSPRVSLEEGIDKTVLWYYETRKR